MIAGLTLSEPCGVNSKDRKKGRASGIRDCSGDTREKDGEIGVMMNFQCSILVSNERQTSS